MSKQYFAKYLAVEGEITDKGVAYKSKKYPHLEAKFSNAPWNKNVMDFYEIEKVKLFLCSKAIQVGDKVWHNVFQKYYEVEKPHNGNTPIKGLFLIGGMLFDERNINLMYEMYTKIIGEISKEATWVKDGDEFTEEEIRIIWGADIRKVWSAGENKHTLLFPNKPEEYEIAEEAEYWAAHEDFGGHSKGYRIYWSEKLPYIHHAKILCNNCKTFH